MSCAPTKGCLECSVHPTGSGPGRGGGREGVWSSIGCAAMVVRSGQKGKERNFCQLSSSRRKLVIFHRLFSSRQKLQISFVGPT
jgi:hypothetical protein